MKNVFTLLLVLVLSCHFNFFFFWLDARRRSSPGACLPSSASAHLALMSRPGVNSLHSSGAGPYLNTVSFSAVVLLKFLATLSWLPLSCRHTDLIWHDLYNFRSLSYYPDIGFIFYLMLKGLTVITLFILLCLCLCVCHGNCLCLCDYLAIWGWCVWWADALPTRNIGSPSWPSEEGKKTKDI